MLKDKLECLGCDVHLADGGLEGMEKTRELRPELVVMGILLAGKNGFEVLAEMKADEDLKDIPVIVLTDLAHHEDRARGLSLGAEDYIVDKSECGLCNLAEKIKTMLEDV